MEEEKRWKLQNIPKVLGRSIVAIFQGRFLLRLDIGKYLIHIMYCFVLTGLAIYLSLMIDSSMRKVEENKAVIAEQEAIITIRTFETEEACSKAEITKKLEQLGSRVRRPEKPATVIR